MIDKRDVIVKTVEHVKEKMLREASGHDWWHVYRVWKMAVKIGMKEGVDLFVTELAALLHDIADWKFHNGDMNAGARVARLWLQEFDLLEETIEHVCTIITETSFKGAGVSSNMKTKEGMVVQDADRLDAIGAIGIARVFAYGGNKGVQMFAPEITPVLHQTFEAYKNNQSSSINHFYEKLLLLKDLMNTKTAEEIAKERHSFMQHYLDTFHAEWELR
jgi:uncharacterized protein